MASNEGEMILKHSYAPPIDPPLPSSRVICALFAQRDTTLINVAWLWHYLAFLACRTSRKKRCCFWRERERRAAQSFITMHEHASCTLMASSGGCVPRGIRLLVSLSLESLFCFLSLSLPTFLLLFAWRRQSLLVPSINIWKGKKKIFFSGRETKLGRGRRENVRSPPPSFALSSVGCRPLCAHSFFWSPKVTAGRNYTFAVNLEAFAASGLMVITTDHAARLLPTPLFSLSFPSTDRRGKRVEKNNDDAPPTTSRNFANHSITDSQTEYNYSAFVAVSGTMQARKGRCT